MPGIKICPSCETKNKPNIINCTTCGTIIASVRLTEISEAVSSPSQSSAPLADGNSTGDTPGPHPKATFHTTPHQTIKAHSPQPFSIDAKEFATLHEIAREYAEKWEHGIADIRCGHLAGWLQNAGSGVPQEDSTRCLDIISRGQAFETDLSINLALFTLIATFAPELPPVWRGVSLDKASLGNVTAHACAGDRFMQKILAEAIQQDLLRKYAGMTGNKELQSVSDSIDRITIGYADAWEKAIDAGVPNELIPEKQESIPAIVHVAVSDTYTSNLRAAISRKITANAQRCPWFAALGRLESATPAELIVLDLLLGRANEWSKGEGKGDTVPASKSGRRNREKPPRDRSTHRHKFSDGICSHCGLSEADSGSAVCIGRRQRVRNQGVSEPKSRPYGKMLFAGIGVMLAVGFCSMKNSSDKSRRVPAPVVKKMTVVAKKANIRVRPDKHSSVAGHTRSGTEYDVVSEQGDWVEVGDNGQKQGWIHRSLMKEISR